VSTKATKSAVDISKVPEPCPKARYLFRKSFCFVIKLFGLPIWQNFSMRLLMNYIEKHRNESITNIGLPPLDMHTNTVKINTNHANKVSLERKDFTFRCFY